MVAFVAIAFVISWSCWIPLALAGLGVVAAQPPACLQVLGTLGPAIAGIAISAQEPGAGARWRARLRGRRMWVGLVLTSLAVCLLVPPVMVATGLLVFGFGEELGWRGFLLPRLQRTRSAASASLVIAGIWAAWHLPLFAFAPAMTKMGPGDAVGWLVSLVSASFLLTWFTNATRGVVAAVAFHGVFATLMTSSLEPAVLTGLGLAVMIAGFTFPFRAPVARLMD